MWDKFKEAQFVTAYTLIVMTFAMDMTVLAMLMIHGKPDGDVYAGMTGILSVWHLALAGAYGYELGSSASSKAKDALLNGKTEEKQTQ